MPALTASHKDPAVRATAKARASRIRIALSAIAGCAASLFSCAYRLAPGASVPEKLRGIGSGASALLADFPAPLALTDLAAGAAFAGLLLLLAMLTKKTPDKFRPGVEYGSARWGTPDDIRPFLAPAFRDNIILTATEGLSLQSRMPDPKYERNKNVLVIGGSGSGKTRFFCLPNLMQLHSSYVIVDPKGTLLGQTGRMLLDAEYRIRVFNTVEFRKSMHYNPFAYLRDETDILKLVTVLLENTKGEGTGGDPFWVKAETMLYTALIGYLFYECRPEEQNFHSLLEMIGHMEVREEEPDFENEIDRLFRELEAVCPDHFAVRQYRKFRLAAGKTARSILVSCGARLAPFDIEAVREITSYDELDLGSLGGPDPYLDPEAAVGLKPYPKTALFLIQSDHDPTYSFLMSMLLTQLCDTLCDRADQTPEGRLPVHVRFLIDEAANIGRIPGLERLAATVRSRNLSICLLLQAQSQLKAIYKEQAETIIGNMDSQLFLGGSEPSTLKDLSERLGKETIDAQNEGESRGREVSHSRNRQKLGKSLLTPDELAVLDGDTCILQIRGVRPFRSKKYDIRSHPNYPMLSDADPGRFYTFAPENRTDLDLAASDLCDCYSFVPAGEPAPQR